MAQGVEIRNHKLHLQRNRWGVGFRSGGLGLRFIGLGVSGLGCRVHARLRGFKVIGLNLGSRAWRTCLFRSRPKPSAAVSETDQDQCKDEESTSHKRSEGTEIIKVEALNNYQEFLLEFMSWI